MAIKLGIEIRKRADKALFSGITCQGQALLIIDTAEAVDLDVMQKAVAPVQVDVQIVTVPRLFLQGKLHCGVAVEIKNRKAFSH